MDLGALGGCYSEILLYIETIPILTPSQKERTIPLFSRLCNVKEEEG